MRGTKIIPVGRLLRRGGFTILELLVVIGIIVILIGILIPVVNKVRRSARAADTSNQLSVIQGAIERYYGDFHAYPGPLPNKMIGVASAAPPENWPAGITANGTGGMITGAENLVLSLCGGLYWNSGTLTFDAARITNNDGVASLNTNQPRTYAAYISTKNLSAGAYTEGGTSANDTNIPEFLDRFSNTMPILYLRANVGVGGVISATNGAEQYDLGDITGYTNTLIGVGKDPNTSMYKGAVPSPVAHGLKTAVSTKVLSPKSNANYAYPYDAYPYFQNPNVPGQARAKDGYILISAGPDRIYGTEDDITTFGSVVP